MGSHRQSRLLRWAGFLFLLDCLLVWVSVLLGIWLRFGVFSVDKLNDYALGTTAASVILPSILYIGGLYSSRKGGSDWISSARWLLFGFTGAVLCLLAAGSLDLSARVGRGVMLAATPVMIVLISVRHLILARRKKERYKTWLCMVTNSTEEQSAEKLCKFLGEDAKTFGILTGGGYTSSSEIPCLGTIENIHEFRSLLKLDAILVRDRHFENKDIATFLRTLRYDGVDIIPLSDACEDAYHAVPLEIITDRWLYHSSNQSELFYIRKLKRLSDVFWAMLFLIILSPFLAFGALAVKLSSRGPVIFRQPRSGRLGRPFTVLKLRTMHVSNGRRKERWATEETARIFPVGFLLRKFRIDEIPQLINVLKGEMSFVGPRPEQPSIVDELAKSIPFYRDRLMIQPGITGWAQVSYPYGASVEDAARKLEYDLYYMKHMGLLFDCVILLDTVKIILCGGVRKGGDADYLRFRENMDSIHETDQSTAPGDQSKKENHPIIEPSLTD